MVHDLLQAADVLDDVVQVREHVVLVLQVLQVSGAGVQVRARHVVVHAHPAAPRSSGTGRLGERFVGPGVTQAVAGCRRLGACLTAIVPVVRGGRQALDGQSFGEGARFMVFGDVNEEVLI